MKCFYHKSDLDGHCSGAIIKREYPECEMIGVDYNDRLEKFDLIHGEKVFVVDFCFEPHQIMFELNKICDLVWIDHHKTAIEWAHESGFLASSGQSLEIGKAGCELTWEFLHDRPIPYAVKMLGRYDVWDHSCPEVLPFQYGMRQEENTRPDAEIWEYVIGSIVSADEILQRGQTILKYETNQSAKYAKGMAYEANFEGYKAIVMNKAYANSKAFDAVYDPDKHDIMILFGIKPGQCKYSLYSNKSEIDVSVIAAKYGGGGHIGAAGFYTENLII